MVGFWANIIKGNPNKLSYKIYQIVRTYSPGNSWITKIESILQDCGMANLWITQDIPSKKWVQCSVKRTLSDHYFQGWLHLETTSNKARMYFSFKDNIKLENYLVDYSSRIKTTLCKFRTANHRLPVEVGRWQRIEYDQRICNLCNSNNIGDEYHFLLECESLQAIRSKYIPQYYWKYPNNYKFLSIIKTSSRKLLSSLGNFLKESFEYSESQL